MFAKARSAMEKQGARSSSPHQPVWLYTGGASHQLFFPTKDEVKDDKMNENMKWHEEEGLKSVECWNWGNERTTRKPKKYPPKNNSKI